MIETCKVLFGLLTPTATRECINPNPAMTTRTQEPVPSFVICKTCNINLKLVRHVSIIKWLPLKKKKKGVSSFTVPGLIQLPEVYCWLDLSHTICWRECQWLSDRHLLACLCLGTSCMAKPCWVGYFWVWLSLQFHNISALKEGGGAGTKIWIRQKIFFASSYLHFLMKHSSSNWHLKCKNTILIYTYTCVKQL